MSTIEINASEYPIKSVTVFKSSKAEIVRTFSLELKAGHNKIEISFLPGTIDTQSVRVSGLSADIRLFDVVCTASNERFKSLLPLADSPPDLIRRLNQKKTYLESEKRVREHEADVLVGYAKTLNGEHVAPTAMIDFLSSFTDFGKKNLDAMNALEEGIIKVQREIQVAEAKMKSKKGKKTGAVTVVLGTDVATKVDFRLTYIVHDAHWQPTYELAATTEAGKPSSTIRFHYHAQITQSTGEDWKDAKLTLSTVTSEASVKLPILRSRKIVIGNRNKPVFSQPANHGFQTTSLPSLFANDRVFPPNNAPMAFGGSGHFLPPQQQQQQQAVPFGVTTAPASSTTGSSLFGNSSGHLFPLQQQTIPVNAFGSVATTAPEAEETLEEITVPIEPTTVITETPLSITYSVDGQSMIPSDGIAHQVSIAILSFDCTTSHVTIPRADPRVFLQCQIKNTSDYRLLPGPASILLDDSFVSRTSIPDININDSFICTLGQDSAAQVLYKLTPKTSISKGGSFAEEFKTTVYTSKITIRNKHQFAIKDLVVRDGIPLADDKRVKVLLIKPEGLATLEEGGKLKVATGGYMQWRNEKEGKLEWRGSVGAGSTVDLDAEWEIQAPSDLVISEIAA